MTIIRDKSGLKKKFYPKFHIVFSENINHHIFSAQKKSQNKSTNIILSLDKDKNFNRKSENCLGKIRSNFVGTQFHIYDNGENPKKKSKPFMSIRREYGYIEYEKNIMGLKGPWKLRVTIPKYNEDYEDFKSLSRGSGIKYATKLATERVHYFMNKSPQWNEEMQAFVLDFFNRCSLASVKNF